MGFGFLLIFHLFPLTKLERLCGFGALSAPNAKDGRVMLLLFKEFLNDLLPFVCRLFSAALP